MNDTGVSLTLLMSCSPKTKYDEILLAKELIRFPTITPIDAGIMKYLEKKLKSLGFKTKILEFKDKNTKPVKNLYARLGKKSPNFCYAGHLDVDPPGNLKDWTVNPFKPSIKKGHLIGRGANIITGDYSVGASGMLIENGEFSYPINEITIAGNLSEMFNNITLANDLEFSYATNSPTLMIEGMVVAGK